MEDTKEKEGVDRDKEREVLINKSFFGDKMNIDVSRIFPVVVMATMSSGKSTLINALLGEDILPNRNAACTAKLFSVLDDDAAEDIKMYIRRRYEREVSVIEKNIQEELERANNDNRVMEILLSGQIQGVQNTDRSLLIIDTPGPNNSRDESHKEIMEGVLRKIYGGLILYVINATQVGINDDLSLLQYVQEQIKKKKSLEVLFVVNKVDELDEERESVWEMLWQIKKYLQVNGFVKPEIIPVSALAANLFKKVIRKMELTRKEKIDFLALYEMFESKDLRLGTYAFMSSFFESDEKMEVGGKEYHFIQMQNAIDNTGISYLESRIQYYQILSSRRQTLQVKLKERFDVENYSDLDTWMRRRDRNR